MSDESKTEEGSGWRPISSAPMDGTPIIALDCDTVIVRGEKLGVVATVIYRNGKWENITARISLNVGMSFEPTHWMPLIMPTRKINSIR